MFDDILQQAADILCALWPRHFPGKDRLKHCKIVSHRGEHDNQTVYENTLPAFDKARDHGVWGIELDVRWTKDLHPVIFHDPTTERLFQDDCSINDLTLTLLKERYSVIPSLKDVVSRYGKSLHLMIEIKKEVYPEPEVQNRVLEDLLSSLEPRIHYHILCLDPDMFQLLNFASARTFLPVAKHNIRELSRLAIEKQYGGVTGHFLLLNNRYLKQHHLNHQQVGTGFVRSKNCLYRELNRNIEWIFSNHAVKLQAIVNEALTL